MSLVHGKYNRGFRTRPPVKQTNLDRELRAQILSGELEPGQRLPTRFEMLRRFAVSKTTVQSAVDRLQADGFVVARGRRGTFVADQPPHLTRYALVFASRPGSTNWGGLSRSLVEAATAIEQASQRKLPCFFDVTGRPDVEDHQRLIYEMNAHQLAGIIFAATPASLAGTPVLDQPGVPRVGIMAPVHTAPIDAVEMNRSGLYFERAFEHLLGQGRRRVATLFKSWPFREYAFQDQLLESLKRHKLDARPAWQQFVDVFDPRAAGNVVQLMFQAGTQDRPNGLIVTDDTMVDSVIAGLMAAGVRVPEDVLVIAHCNFPHSVRTPLPFVRLGFDSHQILEACVASIDRQRAGDTALRVVGIDPVFEHEWRARALSANHVAN
jgi:DNA-binding LacI/PurR family transcriptional regulator